MNPANEQLHALERWRKAQLEAAQTAYASLAAQLERHHADLVQLEEQINDAQDFARDMLTHARELSAAALLQLTQFAALQAAELAHSESALAAVQAEADAAYELLKTRFQELSVIEKLSLRRAAEQRQTELRREQRWLDEQAAGRVPARSSIETMRLRS